MQMNSESRFGSLAGRLIIVFAVVQIFYFVSKPLLFGAGDPHGLDFLPIIIFDVVFLCCYLILINQTAIHVSATVVAGLASLCGIAMSGFLVYEAWTTTRGLISQACLYAVSTILAGEVIYLLQMLSERSRSNGGTRATIF